MAYQPTKGMRPPQLEGRRTGRPRGAKNLASAWRDVQWGNQHADEECLGPPTGGAALWWRFAQCYPDELYYSWTRTTWLEAVREIERTRPPADPQGLARPSYLRQRFGISSRSRREDFLHLTHNTKAVASPVPSHSPSVLYITSFVT